MHGPILMNAALFLRLVFIVIFLTSCQQISFENLKKDASNLVSSIKVSNSEDVSVGLASETSHTISSLKFSDLIKPYSPEVDLSNGFALAVKSAVKLDPEIAVARESLASEVVAIDIAEAAKDFSVTGVVMGGVEDISDEVTGVAFTLNVKRPIFDSGRMDARIAEAKYSAETAAHTYRVKMDQKALMLSSLWVDLELNQSLQRQIDSRLVVLGPLISQLEKVAAAGIGDASKVASAQRTVFAIKAKKESVSEQLKGFEVRFINAFGGLPTDNSYDAEFISRLVPESITSDLMEGSPALNAEYSAYMGAVARLASIEAKNSFSVGLEARAARPLGGSSVDSDESVGLVARKTLYNGKLLDSEIIQARAHVKRSIAQFHATFREGQRELRATQQVIIAMDRAIDLALEDAQVASDEIAYLRKQLIIGGSTLESVLSAEARLYDAESKATQFLAKRRKAELSILAILGLLSKSFGL
ncbi:MAG: hypothetical protein CMO97_01705 [Woeseia sp.]|nr:hypothetical protein [Woeseia sp.]